MRQQHLSGLLHLSTLTPYHGVATPLKAWGDVPFGPRGWTQPVPFLSDLDEFTCQEQNGGA
jgi:hypothetical protein